MLGEILLELGVLDEPRLAQALRKQEETNQRLGDLLLEEGAVQEVDLTRALAEQYDMEMVDLEETEVRDEVLELVPADIARKQRVVPIDYDEDANTLVVAVGAPLDLYTLDNLRFVVNCQIEAVLATKQAIQEKLALHYGADESEGLDDMIQEFTQEMTQSDIRLVEEGIEEVSEAETEDAPVVKLVTMIITEAVRSRASDIHIEPMTDRLRIRYRVDGRCYEVNSPPKRLQAAIIARLKIMAQMNMAERRRPQDGRIKISVLGRQIDLRVSALPGTQGESVVMRILDKEAVLFGLDQLGFHPDDYATFQRLIRRPNGIILVTGPTGSGKTTTLYAALNELNRSDQKIITAEDPVEYNIAGINQSQVNRKAGMTFERIIRAMLRQAPNIILVGEIRDEETAETAIQAALTGHLVFSTLHTNDAPSAITRLIDMGVAPFLVASSIQAVLAQRLVRRICNECKQPTEPDQALLRASGMNEDQIKSHTFFTGSGCDNCKGIGFRGRRAIYEIMVMNARLREMAFNVEPTDAIRSQAMRDGMHTLLMDGLRKVIEGNTTIEEVLTVAKKYD
jgi:type IV pilus assembly protein PilB